MAVLQVVKGLNPGQLFHLEGRDVLGRHPKCQIVLDDGAVSREHAHIEFVDGRYYVHDRGSRNGTFVNDERIVGSRRLEESDQVKICDFVFAFHQQPPKPKRPADTIEDSSLAVMVEDEETSSTSTIMSKLDVSSSDTGLRVSVKPEAKLQALLEITANLSNALELGDVLQKTLDTLFKIFVQADRGFVVLREGEHGPLIPKAVKHRRGGADQTIRISRTIVNQAMQLREAILSADAASDSRFDMSQSIADFRIRSMMCAPLVDSDGHALGVIQIDTLDQKSRFRDDDLELLASVARQAAFAVENAQLHEGALRRQALERDLELAHKVQQDFLPDGAPTLAGYEFFHYYEPANQLGGDYYDYISLPGGRLAVIVADVAGKGVPAALLMAKLSAEVKFCLAGEPEPAGAIRRVNESFATGWEGRFITTVLGVIDPAENRLTIVNAGHMPPMLRLASGEVIDVGGDEAGYPLGIDAECPYQPTELSMAPGDRLTMFTDGISEAMNAEDDIYGLERLRKQIAGASDNVADLGSQILADVKRFVGSRPQTDDMCVTCFGRVP